MLKFLLAASLFVAATAASAGKGDDLDNCRFGNGLPIQPKVCAMLRQSEAEKAAREERWRADREAAVQRESERKAAEMTRREQEAERQHQEHERLAAESEARQREFDRRVAAADAQQARAEKAAAAKEASVKAACGGDYHALRIGMTIERAQQCFGKFTMAGQVNRPDAVVSMYRHGGTVAHVIAGKVVAWFE